MNTDRLALTLNTLLSHVRHHEQTLSSGPGALMFEHSGPTTRIRRAPVRAFAAITWEGGPREIFGQVLNLSPGGCLLKTETTLTEGMILSLAIKLVGSGQSESTQVRAQIKRVGTDEGRRAYGLEFLAESSEESKHLQWLYAQAISG